MSHVSPIPPLDSPSGTPRVGGYDRFGTPQDTVGPRIVPPTMGPQTPPRSQHHAYPGAPAARLPRHRSTLLAVLLTLVFGPFGLLYCAPVGALVTGLLTLVMALPFALLGAPGLAVVLMMPVYVLWAITATTAHNGLVGLTRRLHGAPRW